MNRPAEDLTYEWAVSQTFRSQIIHRHPPRPQLRPHVITRWLRLLGKKPKSRPPVQAGYDRRPTSPVIIDMCIVTRHAAPRRTCRRNGEWPLRAERVVAEAPMAR